MSKPTLSHVEHGGLILCSDRLSIYDCDWFNIEFMYDNITCPDCIRIAEQRFDEDNDGPDGFDE